MPHYSFQVASSDSELEPCLSLLDKALSRALHRLRDFGATAARPGRRWLEGLRSVLDGNTARVVERLWVLDLTESVDDNCLGDGL
jgi:hypothetical protein